MYHATAKKSVPGDTVEALNRCFEAVEVSLEGIRMKLESIELTNFRNIRSLRLKADAGVNIFTARMRREKPI